MTPSLLALAPHAAMLPAPPYTGQATSSVARRPRRFACHERRQLRPRPHVELAEDPPQVRLDRLRAQEERRGDLAVRHPLRHKQRDLQLLRGELARERVALG